MRTPKAQSHEEASALILVLLITALLATITVSFLSTSRVEMIAARNFSRQNAAAGLAELATQQAMAQIQKGFNATGGNGTGNFTTVITTQPGAINKYFFSNGTLQSNRTITTGLFTSGSGNLSYLNNLQNPSSNSSATTDQWTITGNASERINVFMENITTSVNGSTQLVGRVAYYVDDEASKLNLNSATGNRDTLNAGIRPLDIAALSSNSATSFASIVNGTSSNSTSSITSWSYFFRPEQATFLSANALPFLTTATSSNFTANMTHLLTPWGTQRLNINELSTNPTDGSGDASVRSIFEAFTGLNGTTMNAPSNSTYGLTGRGLQNIYGGNFSTKYTNLGVKQIGANMLQMRDPNTNTINASFSYTGPLIGSANLTATPIWWYPGLGGIPVEYLGYAPYPVISEIGMSARWTFTGGGDARIPIRDANGTVTGNETIEQYDLGLKMEPVVEFYNPYPYQLTIPPGAFPRLLIYPKIVSFEMSWTAENGSFIGNFTSNATHVSTTPSAWNYSSWFGQQGYDGSRDDRTKYATLYEANGNSTTIPAYSKIQTRFYYSMGPAKWGTYFVIPRRKSAVSSNYPNNSSNITINSIRNVKIDFYNIKLLANSNSTAGNATGGHENTIRDWVRGDEIGTLEVEMLPQPFPFAMTWNGTILNAPTDSAWLWGAGASGKAPPVPTKTAQRISHLSKIPMATPAITINDTNRNWTTANNSTSTYWLETTPTWGCATSSNYGKLSNSTSASESSIKAPPSNSANSTIPSDPSLGDSVSNAVYAGSNATDMREPFLVTGNYTCPADLGFVPTNQRWRRLRMQMQPSAEGSLIPDWAMLDVITFGNSTNASSPLNRMPPVNINGRFHLPGNVTNSSPPAPRTIGLRALAKVLENSGADKIQDTMNPATSNSTDATRFRGNTANATTIANAIGNMTWSAGSTWATRRSSRNFPSDQYILPSEIMEIAGVADAVDQTDYTNSASHFKWNEGRASALIPAVTTRSSFFSIYAYAQALDKNQVVESEALTKTLVEVQYNSGNYTVKKLYTQFIPLGQ